jgi:hypothetical protein
MVSQDVWQMRAGPQSPVSHLLAATAGHVQVAYRVACQAELSSGCIVSCCQHGASLLGVRRLAWPSLEELVRLTITLFVKHLVSQATPDVRLLINRNMQAVAVGCVCMNTCVSSLSQKKGIFGAVWLLRRNRKPGA